MAHFEIITRLKNEVRDRPGLSILVDIPNELTLADYFFGRVWPGSKSVMTDRDVFKPSAMVWLVYKYKLYSMLDTNVGRGNRLVACLLEDLTYVGIYDYLATKPMAERVLKAGDIPAEKLNLVYGNYDNITIGDLAWVGDKPVDAIFLSLDAAHSDAQRCSWIIKAWSNLSPDKLLIIYSDHYDQQLRLLTSDVIETLVGVSRQSDKFHELSVGAPPSLMSEVGSAPTTPGSDPRVRVLRKTDQPASYPFPPITLLKKVYRVGRDSLFRRALGSYLRSFGTHPNLHYLCSSFIRDVAALDLAAIVPVGQITFHVNKDKRWANLISELAKPGHRVVSYSDDSNKERVRLQGPNTSLNPRDVLLPSLLDSPLFEAWLVQILRVYLPQEAGALITEERVWLESDYPVLVRALLYVWPETTLIVATNTPPDMMRGQIPFEWRGRAIFHRIERGGQSKKPTLRSMRTELGYDDDALLE